MAGQFLYAPLHTALDADAAPINAATASFFLTTTTTPADVYHDAAMGTPWVQPIAADSAGRFPTIYLDPSITYKMVYKDAGGVTIDTFDPVNSIFSAGDLSFLQLGAGAGTRTMLAKAQETISVEDFYQGTSDDYTAWMRAFDRIQALGGGTIFATSPTGYVFTQQVDFDATGLTSAVDIVGRCGRITTTGAISGLHISGSSSVVPISLRSLIVDHRANASAIAGFEAHGTANLVFYECGVLADDGVAAAYAAIHLHNTDPDNDATSCFWTRFPGTWIRSVNGVANPIPTGVWLDGPQNATSFAGINIVGCTKAVKMTKATGTTLAAGSRELGGNAISFSGAWIEDVTTVCSYEGAAGDLGPRDLFIRGARLENATTILSMTGATVNQGAVPIIGPNSEINCTNIVNNPNSLYYAYESPHALGPSRIQNGRGIQIRNYDSAYDGLTLVPAGNGSGLAIQAVGGGAVSGYLRPVTGGALELSADMVNFYGLSVKGATGLSTSGTAAKNLAGQATLSGGVKAVTFPVRNEADANYLVFVTGAANETFKVTAKATTGFTITSSNGASTTTVDWLLVRNG